MKRIAIFASGNGTNAENIIDHFNVKEKSGEVALIVCNRSGAGVVERAKRLNVPVALIDKNKMADKEYMLGLLEDHNIDFVVLAGFLMMIPSYLIEEYRDSIINIHPSLLPAYGGKGMYGRHVHEAVVAAGEKETGITIHRVSEECDGGEILFQAKIPVTPEMSVEDVEKEIHRLEASHFPVVIERILSEV